jgi:cytochrome oxidase assembly protein ShyY1
LSSFRPSPSSTLFLGVLAALFVYLGIWQLDRREEKESLVAAFESAPQLILRDALKADHRFARVVAHGSFDRRTYLYDNRILEGRAGVHALSPFRLESGQWILVNRGWLPMPPDRRSLPQVTTPEGWVKVQGMLAPFPSDEFRLGESDRVGGDEWPKLVTYLDPAILAGGLDEDLLSWIVLLDRNHPDGFAGRDWTPSSTPPARHTAYAAQWFGLAITTFACWIVLAMRNRRSPKEGQRS